MQLNNQVVDILSDIAMSLDAPEEVERLEKHGEIMNLENDDSDQTWTILNKIDSPSAFNWDSSSISTEWMKLLKIDPKNNVR